MDGKFTAHEEFVGWDIRLLYDPFNFGEEIFAGANDGQITATSMPPCPENVGRRFLSLQRAGPEFYTSNADPRFQRLRRLMEAEWDCN